MLVSVLVFIGLWTSGRTFIYKTDGWPQHYKALVYWGRYLRSFIKSLLLNHSFSVAEWDPAIGEGSDILTTLHYYVIGDPLCLLAAFVPTRYMWVLYDILSLIRLYLSGLAFTLFCYSTGQKNKYGVLAGSLTYTFCGWALLYATTHVYFINPMIYLPMILMGVERIIRKKRKGLLSGSVFLAVCSNFYFFYMLVCITVVYTLIRLLILCRNKFRKGLQILFHIAAASLIGVFLSAFIFLPVMYAFISNGRMSVYYGKRLLYPLAYYANIPGMFVSNIKSYSMIMMYSITVIPALFLLFKEKRQYRILKVFFVICMIIVMFPSLGQALNGFSYITNRWCFAFAMLVAYIQVVMWDKLMRLSERDAGYVLVCSIGYFVLCMLLHYFSTKETMTSLALLLMLLCILIYKRDDACDMNMEQDGCGKGKSNLHWRQMATILITIVSICVYGFNRYYVADEEESPDSWTSIKETEYLLQTEAKIVKMLGENEQLDEPYRYSGRNITTNANMLAGVSSTDYYWSIANPYASEFRSLMGVGENSAYHYSNYSDCATLTALSGTLYYAVRLDDRQPVPYGFSLINSFDIHENSTTAAMEALQQEIETTELSKSDKQNISDLTAEYYSIYRNNNPLPLTYSYDRVVSAETWMRLNRVEMQEVLEQAVVLEQADSSAKVSLNSQVPDDILICNGDEVTRKGNSFVVTAPGASITLLFAGMADSETYVLVDGLHYDSSSVYELYFGDQKKDPLNLYNKTRWSLLPYGNRREIIREHLFRDSETRMFIEMRSSAGTVKYLEYTTPYWTKYCERHNFSINLGHTQEPVTEITITFPYIGTYSYDSIKVACKPMGDFSERMDALKSCTLEHMEMENDTISGTIHADRDKWLCLAIPYSSGWRAYLDGRETVLHRANIQYMAVQIPAGEHEIRLVYETPLLRAGMCISAITALLCIAGMLCINAKKRRKR